MNKIILLVCFVSTLLAGVYSATLDINIDPLVKLPTPDVVVVPPVPTTFSLGLPSWFPQITFSDG